jgi:hypothetical protein
MSNAPIFPGPGAFDDESDTAGLREVDGELILDGDANDELIESADADRLASFDEDEQ